MATINNLKKPKIQIYVDKIENYKVTLCENIIISSWLYSNQILENVPNEKWLQKIKPDNCISI